MNFPYSSLISRDPATGDLLLLRRPEMPVTIVGPSSSATYIGLVDIGSDNTIFPQSVANLLGIATQPSTGPSATAFGGSRIALETGEANLRIEADRESASWRATISFFDFPTADEETVILGHAAFLDYFTAIFDGKAGVLTLLPNDELPVHCIKSIK